MQKKKQRNIVDKLPEALMKQIRRSRTLIAEELPDLIRRDQMAHDAMREKTFSGVVRKAIHRCKILLPDLAARSEVKMDEIADFLTGEKPLSSDALDRLVKVLKLKLTNKRAKPRRAKAG